MKESEQSAYYPSLTNDGVSATWLVGGRFKEFLDECGPEAPVAIYDVDTRQSRETAEVLRAALGERGWRPRDCSIPTLSPSQIPTYGAGTDEGLARQLETVLGDKSESFVVVGHDPQTSWLAVEGLRGSSRGFSLISSELVWRARPVARSRYSPLKLLRGRFRRNVALEWVFSPSDPTSSDHVRKKIESKMNSAKVLGTFLTALLTFVAGAVLREDDPDDWFLRLSSVGLGFLGLAIVLFLALYRYDSLLMPTRFWGSRPGASLPGYVRRPPAPDVWVLTQSMVRIWNRVFTPAVASAGVGVALVIAGFTEPNDLGDLFKILGIAAAFVLMTAGFGWLSRPGLGTND